MIYRKIITLGESRGEKKRSGRKLGGEQEWWLAARAGLVKGEGLRVRSTDSVLKLVLVSKFGASLRGSLG